MSEVSKGWRYTLWSGSAAIPLTASNRRTVGLGIQRGRNALLVYGVLGRDDFSLTRDQTPMMFA